MKIKNPVFIIGCPRSGTSLLFRILSESKELWSSYRESHYLWDKFLPDRRDQFFSVHLTENDFKDEDRKYLENKYHLYTYNTYALGYLSRILFFRETLKPLYELWSLIIFFFKSLFLKEYRIIDKTPTNTYKVSYIKKAFPDAKFIYLTRDGKTNISSLIEAWTSNNPKFTFKKRSFYEYNSQINIAGYDGKVWKFTNPPGWQNYLDKSIEEVCAFQWLSAHEFSQKSFSGINKKDFIQIKYEDLIKDPQKLTKDICNFLDIEYSPSIQKMTTNLPMVSMVSKPNPEKWKKNQDKINKILPVIAEMQKNLGYENALETAL